MFEGQLVEVLLSAILMFNIGAYTFLWRKTRSTEKDVENHAEYIDRILYRIFGYGDDATNQGHLVETQTRFDDIDNKLEEISQKLDKESQVREQEFQMIEHQLAELYRELSNEEALEFDDELDINRQT